MYLKNNFFIFVEILLTFKLQSINKMLWHKNERKTNPDLSQDCNKHLPACLLFLFAYLQNLAVSASFSNGAYPSFND